MSFPNELHPLLVMCMGDEGHIWVVSEDKKGFDRPGWFYFFLLEQQVSAWGSQVTLSPRTSGHLMT